MDLVLYWLIEYTMGWKKILFENSNFSETEWTDISLEFFSIFHKIWKNPGTVTFIFHESQQKQHVVYKLTETHLPPYLVLMFHEYLLKTSSTWCK